MDASTPTAPAPHSSKWHKYTETPILLDSHQRFARGLALLIELATIGVFIWFFTSSENTASIFWVGFAAIIIAGVIDIYETFRLHSKRRPRKHRLNPWASLFDMAAAAVGIAGYVLAPTHRKYSYTIELDREVIKGLVLADACIHGLFLLLGIVGAYVLSQNPRKRNSAPQKSVETPRGSNETV